MSTIRPISRRFPQSKSLWEETNLPMCAVLTPTGDIVAPKNGADPLKLAMLIRCLKCGAPHPSIDTYDLLEDNELIYCHLCGNTSSYKFDEQMKVRTNDGLKELVEDGEDDDWPFIADERQPKEDIFVELPLFNDQDYFSESPKACPPVWWVVLDGTMPQSSPYWKTVTQSLQEILAGGEDGPPEYAHIGLLLASQDTLSTWDLSSPVPRVCHYPLSSASGKTSKEKDKNYSSDNVVVDLCLTPVDPIYQPNVQATLRAVSDNPSLRSTPDINSADTGMALGGTIETILEFMEQAKHPGDTLEGDSESSLLYAGGKITCLLGRPPLEIEPLDVEPQSSFGLGGMGGAIHDAMQVDKFATMGNKDDSSDLTPNNLARYCKPLQPSEDVFDIIGTRCAHAAMGVDIVVVETHNGGRQGQNSRRQNIDFIRPFYGLPLLRVLADTSGAPGPLLVHNTLDLTQQVRARTPWQPGMTFATEMRIRMSPGWSIETSPIEPIRKATHQMAIYLSSSGVAGPAIATNDNFFLLGTCDGHTSVTLDMQNTDSRRKVQLEQKIYGLRGRVGQKVMLKPVIQTCVAYTCIESRKGSSARVVRRMKISACPMPMAMDVESIYNSIDPEALAAALFHKLALNVYEEGTVSTQQVGIDWLKAFLVCVYQSALNVLEDEGKKKVGMPNHQETDEEYRRNPFDASLRLLTSSGDQILTLSPKKKGKKTLEVDDVLLGQGHRRVSSLPLVVYCLLQCDALRPSPHVSADARCAAIAQMASMTPRDLVKCIAPSLSLWSSKDDAPVTRSIDLSLLEAIKAFKRGESERRGDLVFVLDSPQQLLVFKGNLKQETKKFKLGLKPYTPKSPKLAGMIEAMSSSYRVKPFNTADDENQSESASSRRFVQTMIEDMPTAASLDSEGSINFKSWKSDMAQLVQAELEELHLIQ